jgi:hypothetical protein
MTAEREPLALKSSEIDPVQTAIRFIAAQFGGPGRVLARHRTTVTGACAACSAARPVHWPCSIAAMAMQAERQTR